MASGHKLFRYFQLLLIILAAGSIFPIIYLRHGYELTILEVFNIELYQLNLIFSVMGVVTFFGYIPSGYLSDKFSAKWLISISLFMTGLMGLWFARVPPLSHLIIIYVVWGFFSIFTFWGAQIKLIKLLANANEEGKFFGMWDGGRGVVEALLAMLALFIFGHVMGRENVVDAPRLAITAVIYMYSISVLIVAVLIAIFVKSDKDPQTSSFKNDLIEMTHLLKNKQILLMGGIIFTGYSVFWTFRTMSRFMQSYLGVTAVTAAAIMVVAQWLRPVGGILGGYFADKLGKTKVISTTMGIGSALLVVVALLPQSVPVPFTVVVILLTITFLWAIRGTYWSILGDCQLPAKSMGLGIGVISLIGYLPDVFSPMLNTAAFGLFGEAFGHNGYFILSALFGVVGMWLLHRFRKGQGSRD